MADWDAMRTEYITTQISYRALAAKYGVNQATICKRSKAEGWIEQREQLASKAQAKTLDALARNHARRAERLQTVADKVMDKITEILEGDEFATPKDIRQITAALKDLKDVQMLRSDADAREQEARIDNLRRQADKGSARDDTISVVWGEMPEEDAQ